ncbi:ankyrin repeat-containing domain protein [Hypoxylon rubiginosum]|uniref:Ankyrin repeat-containing domain protein n=1 Tax=Hypoxylon rubiginosum TaxID=110542 RepID=A0ACB9ZC45_9PEZI|nr:ankyrin repeat-containing domain protein [Hypoxylon rubiginosum]
MASLLALPVELILMILAAEHTDPKDFNNHRRNKPEYDRRVLLSRDLYKLTLVCGKLRRIVNPFLYAFNMKFDDFNVLHRAIDRDSVATLQIIEELGLDLDYWDKKLLDPGHLLERAFTLNRPNTFSYLLNYDPWCEMVDKVVELGPPYHFAKHSRLRCALEKKLEKVALVLLERGVNLYFLETRGGRGFTTALHIAARNDLRDVVEYLLGKDEEKNDEEKKNRLQVDVRDSAGASPLYRTIEADKFYVKPGRITSTVNQLIHYKADVNISVSGQRPLGKAILMQNFSHADILLKAGAKIRHDDDREGTSHLVHMCVGLNLYHTHYQRPRQFKMLQKLVEAGADLEEKDEHDHTPLQHAILHTIDWNQTMVAHLIGRGVSTSGILDFLAKESGRPNFTRVVAILMEKLGTRIDVPLATGPHTLMEHVAFNNDPATVEGLLACATPETLSRKHLNDVLEKCMMRNYLDICYVLTRHGVVLQDPGKAYVAAHRMMQKSSTQPKPDIKEQWLEMLLDLGIPPEKTTCLVTHALKCRDKIGANYLLCRRRPRIQPDPQWLRLASVWGEISVVEKILALTEDVNLLSKFSRTPLADAVASGTEKITIRLLLLHGANPFLPPNAPLFPKDTDWKTVKRSPGVSAFEIAIRDDKLLPVVKEMWHKTPPDNRPELDSFIACVPDGCPKISRWLTRTKDSLNPKSCPAEQVGGGKEHDNDEKCLSGGKDNVSSEDDLGKGAGRTPFELAIFNHLSTSHLDGVQTPFQDRLGP